MNKGFTLIELLLVIALFSVVAGFTVPISQIFQNQNNLSTASSLVVSELRRAQLASITGFRDSVWGVRVTTGSITVFRGSSFASRDTSFDEVVEIPSGITVSGTTEYVFSKLTGTLSGTGTILLTSPNNETQTVVLNSEGSIEY